MHLESWHTLKDGLKVILRNKNNKKPEKRFSTWFSNQESKSIRMNDDRNNDDAE